MRTPPAETHPPTELVVGAGAVARVGELARAQGARRVLLVTDKSLVSCGHAARVTAALDAAGLTHETFDGVCANPTGRDVELCLADLRAFGPDLVCALGGGSAIDTAKGALLLLAGGGAMADYRGHARGARPLLPLLAIPTTAGTGSEVQSFALIADDETRVKMACGDPQAAPRVAILDPELTVTQPRRVTACTGLDAIGHAVETAVTNVRTPTSTRYAHEALRLALPAFARVMEDGADLSAREDLLRAAAAAGMAIEHSMLGIAHSLANPLTAHFDVVHGQAVATMLPHVVRFNGADPAVARRYAELAAAAGLGAGADGPVAPGSSDENGARVEALAARLEELLSLAGLPASLGELGVRHAALPELAAEAAAQWTAGFNPRPVGAEELRGLYERAL